MSLSDHLLDPAVRPDVVGDCVWVVEQEVASKRGISGAAIKAAFALVCKIKPGFVAEVVDNLLPDFAAALEPIHAEAQARASGDEAVADAFVAAVLAERGRASQALLSVTDRKIDRARPAVRSAYAKLRPSALEHVEVALPRLVGRLRSRLLRA